jgi:hypothetical protein
LHALSVLRAVRDLRVSLTSLITWINLRFTRRVSNATISTVAHKLHSPTEPFADVAHHPLCPHSSSRPCAFFVLCPYRLTSSLPSSYRCTHHPLHSPPCSRLARRPSIFIALFPSPLATCHQMGSYHGGILLQRENIGQQLQPRLHHGPDASFMRARECVTVCDLVCTDTAVLPRAGLRQVPYLPFVRAVKD